MKKYNTLVVIAASLLLVGCGGGGESGSMSTSEVNYNSSTNTLPSANTSSGADTPSGTDTSYVDSDGDTSASDQLTKQWSLQMVAEDPQSNLLFDNSRLGQLEVASNEVDAYDLKSMSRPFTKNSEGELLPFLYVNFLQEDKNYTTNFHNTQIKYDEWTFSVNSNPERTVTLRWNVYAVTLEKDASGRVRFDQKLHIDENLMGRMQLVDAETNETLVSAYAEGRLQSYTFNMNDRTIRTFRWALETEKVTENVQETSAKSNALYKGASAKQYASEMESQIDITALPRPMGQE